MSYSLFPANCDMHNGCVTSSFMNPLARGKKGLSVLHYIMNEGMRLIILNTQT